MTYINRLENLDSKTSKLFKKLESFSYDKLSFSDDKWSVSQILYHVWLAEVSSEKYIRTKIKYPETIIKTPVSSYIKAFLVFISLYGDFSRKHFARSCSENTITKLEY